MSDHNPQSPIRKVSTDVVECKALVIRDAKGRKAIELACSPSEGADWPRIRMYDGKGELRVEIDVFDESDDFESGYGAAVTLFGSRGEPAIALCVDQNGTPYASIDGMAGTDIRELEADYEARKNSPRRFAEAALGILAQELNQQKKGTHQKV